MRLCELEAECAMRRTIFGLGLVADVETKAGVGRYGPQCRVRPNVMMRALFNTANPSEHEQSLLTCVKVRSSAQ